MYFNSLAYFLFLPIAYVSFYLVGDRARWCVLLAASVIFYAALEVPYLLAVLLLVTIVTYGFGIWLHRAATPTAKRSLLWSGIAANVLILVVMKYLPFLSENLKALCALFSLRGELPSVQGLVAVGVSYYVFQAISYLFDVYLEVEKPERHLGYFALYMAFFPKLLQGPIERAGDLLPQLKEKYHFDYDNVRFGMLLFTWGLFKKAAIADRLAFFVGQIYNDVHLYKGLPLILATYAYSFQIYMDFSGYTDMALGTALLFNIRLTRNFDTPYLATSVADFWRRWHITFSRWILDYIFRPLQMQWRDWRNWGSAAALIIAFVISGIWHGASWGFVIWGGLHGLYMACSLFYKPYQKKLHKRLGLQKTRTLAVWQVFVTFNLVSFAWIFFRANSASDAFYVASNLIPTGMNLDFVESIFTNGKLEIVIPPVALLLVAAVGIVLQFPKLVSSCKRSAIVRWTAYFVLVILLMLLNTNSNLTFIYNRF